MPVFEQIRIHEKQLAKVKAAKNHDVFHDSWKGAVTTVGDNPLPFDRWKAYIHRELKRRKVSISLTIISI